MSIRALNTEPFNGSGLEPLSSNFEDSGCTIVTVISDGGMTISGMVRSHNGTQDSTGHYWSSASSGWSKRKLAASSSFLSHAK
jgi:hypothetical protein